MIPQQDVPRGRLLRADRHLRVDRRHGGGRSLKNGQLMLWICGSHRQVIAHVTLSIVNGRREAPAV
jgi:hypothetical protein